MFLSKYFYNNQVLSRRPFIVKRNLWQEFLFYKEKWQWLSQKYLNWLKSLFNNIQKSEYLDLSSLESFTLENCLNFLNENTKWSNSTYNFYVKILTVFLNFLNENYWGINFIKKIPQRKIIKNIPKFYTIEELKIIFSALETEEEKNIIYFFLYSWVRRNEFLNIQPHDIKKDYIYLRKSKGWRDRIIPLHPKIYNIKLNFPYSNTFLFRLLEKIQKKFKPFKYHNLRHTFSYNLKMNWCDIYDVSQLLWHKSIVSTVAYSGLDVLNKYQKLKNINFNI